jgi:hypothetical protein
VKTLFRILSLVFLAAVFSYTIIVFAQQTQNSGNDVYNFYFQKAPGPQTVIQGGAQPAQVPTPVPPPQPTPPTLSDTFVQQQAVPTNSNAASTNPTASEVSDFKRWEVTFGWADQMYYKTIQSDGTKMKSLGARTGVGVGIRRNINRYFAVEGGLSYTPNDSEELIVHSRELKDDNLGAIPNLSGFAGAVVTPLKLNLFGHEFIELSAIGGAMTYNEPHDVKGSATNVAGYLGPRLALNLSNDFGLELSSKYVVTRSVINENSNTRGRPTSSNLVARWRF